MRLTFPPWILATYPQYPVINKSLRRFLFLRFKIHNNLQTVPRSAYRYAGFNDTNLDSRVKVCWTLIQYSERSQYVCIIFLLSWRLGSLFLGSLSQWQCKMSELHNSLLVFDVPTPCGTIVYAFRVTMLLYSKPHVTWPTVHRFLTPTLHLVRQPSSLTMPTVTLADRHHECRPREDQVFRGIQS